MRKNMKKTRDFRSISREKGYALVEESPFSPVSTVRLCLATARRDRRSNAKNSRLFSAPAAPIRPMFHMEHNANTGGASKSPFGAPFSLSLLQYRSENDCCPLSFSPTIAQAALDSPARLPLDR
jgi:hypothetical protein